MKKLFISGVSGFLGTHIVLEALRRGYQVVGTVRSAEKGAETTAVLSKYLRPEIVANFQFTLADLNSPAHWQEAMKGCDAILHVASPFPLGLPKHENDLILPARNGVKHVFDAAIASGIHRIVQTSSIAAIMYGHEKGKTQFDETDWSNLAWPELAPYNKSKTMAEQDVWDYAKKHPELKVTVINPGFVLGPVLGKDVGTSADVVLKLMNGEYPGVPKLGFPIVDVRDVAKLHLNALEMDASIGQRYAAVSESIWFVEMAKFILEAQPKCSKYLKVRELPNWFIRIYSLFEKTTRMILPELGFCATVSNAKAKRDLGFVPISAKEAVKACADSLVELNLAKP